MGRGGINPMRVYFTTKIAAGPLADFIALALNILKADAHG
jgi:hypothetical protein